MPQDEILGHFRTLKWTIRDSGQATQDDVLGHSQSDLSKLGRGSPRIHAERFA